MKKLLLVLLIICLAAFGFGGLHASVSQTRAANTAANDEFTALAHRLGETQKAKITLQNELVTRQNHLRLATRHANITPDLLGLLESDFAKGSLSAWTELRRQLDIGWNSSPDYVLVNKQTLKDVSYDKLSYATHVTDLTCDMLSLSPQEKSALESALKQAKSSWQGFSIQRNEPSGDILAQYTVSLPGPDAELSLSNNFTAGLAAAVGPERADLLARGAWNEFRSQMGMNQTGTLTIRQITANGEPDLTWEMQLSNQTYSEPVRYAHYPSGWFLTYFPGGWDTLAKRENFPLPAAFHK